MPNRRAFAWALGIMALLCAMAVARHHVQMIEHYPAGHPYQSWGHAILQEAPHYVFWALVIPLVYVLVNRLARHASSLPLTLLAHAACALGVVLVASLLRGLWDGDPNIGATILTRLPSQAFTYAAIVGGVLAYHYARASARREVAAGELAAELAEARLRALRAQLQPHFMFNALNSVAMLVRGGRGPEAVDTIAKVSALLRESLDDDDRGEVTLAEEVALARRYLAIEEVRFSDRLQVRVEMTDEAKSARVPRLILQPLVENAVRHGLGGRTAAGLIEISGKVVGDRLIVSVRDDGPGPKSTPDSAPESSPPGPLSVPERGNVGVGLRNTRARLEVAYGFAAGVTLEHAPGGGAIATLVIPVSRSVIASPISGMERGKGGEDENSRERGDT